MFLLEFRHVRHQRVDRGDVDGVVDGGAHAAHRAVALEVEQTALVSTGIVGVTAAIMDVSGEIASISIARKVARNFCLSSLNLCSKTKLIFVYQHRFLRIRKCQVVTTY